MSADPEREGFKGEIVHFLNQRGELDRHLSPRLDYKRTMCFLQCQQGVPDLTSDVIRWCQCATQKRGSNTYSVQFDDSGVFTFILSIFI